VIELHLIGYTEDAEHLVLDLDAGAEGRYTLRVDPDLLATLEAVRDERVATGRPVDRRREPAPPAPPAPPRPEPDPLPPPRLRPRRPVPAPAEVALPDNGRAGPAGGGGAPPAAAASADEPEADAPAVDDTPAARSRLSPAEIQAQLRSGRSVRSVAKEAGTDRAWIERWLAPILAERDRVLDDARTRRIDRPHARALGGSVERALADRGVDPEDARWRVSRRDDGRWRITVAFDERGRARSATWLLDPSQAHLRPQSPLATELASPRRRDGARRR
jgi:hypothetical protein